MYNYLQRVRGSIATYKVATRRNQRHSLLIGPYLESKQSIVFLWYEVVVYFYFVIRCPILVMYMVYQNLNVYAGNICRRLFSVTHFLKTYKRFPKLRLYSLRSWLD